MPRERKPKNVSEPDNLLKTDTRSPSETKVPPLKGTRVASEEKKSIEKYEHKDKKRCNNPPIGLVRAENDPDDKKKTYQYDPHLDPQLQWAGKAEHTSFEVSTVSLHVHERIDPYTIINAVKKRNGTGARQVSLFEYAEENPPIREAIEFYKHKHGWSNRLIAGDSLLVMNSLLEKEGMAGKVQMIYIDPPYGIKYGSNFQPFVNKRDVKDGKDEDLTQEPEMIKAFRDTWELGIHSYLAYLRDRLFLARELLTDSGSVFVQISDENIHHVREIMDEIFGESNFVAIISYQKTTFASSNLLPPLFDYVIWYAKDKKNVKYRQLFIDFSPRDVRESFKYISEGGLTGKKRMMSKQEIEGTIPLPPSSVLFMSDNITSPGATSSSTIEFEFQGKKYFPGKNLHWKTTHEGLKNLARLGRLYAAKNSLRFVRIPTDFPYHPVNNLWSDTTTGSFLENKIYVVQTSTKAIARCILMTTDPGDLVLDPTCGSGSTAHVAEQWGRRWITCDTSRVAITLAKQRLMTPVFEYYELQHPEQGVSSGFRYKTVPHITLKSIANNEPSALETLYDQPFIDESRVRVSGPFTVEAVPSPTVKPLIERNVEIPADESVARGGETLRQSEWRDELLRTGIRGKGGQKIEFTRVEPLSGARWLHAEAATKDGQVVVLSFGPEHGPLEPKQVELAIKEAERRVPKPNIVLFVAFQFDPEAAKNVDETKWKDVTLLKVQMNADLLTDDLKKKRVSNESFWLIGQPDVQMQKIDNGEDKGKCRVQVLGFDYYDTKNGDVVSGGANNIAVWMLDTDYDGRSLYPRQVFFPMADEKGGWSRLAKNLKAEIDQDLIEAYHGTTSLPFKLGTYNTIAVKIVDDRGIESIKIIEVD